MYVLVLYAPPPPFLEPRSKKLVTIADLDRMEADYPLFKISRTRTFV